MPAYSVPATRDLDTPILQGLQESSSAATHKVGTRVCSRDGREFTFVVMQCSGVAMYSGRPMVWIDGTADYQVTPNISDSASNEGNSGFAGVATMNNINVTSCYCWIQTRGLVDAALVSTTVDVNEALIVALSDDCFEDADGFMNSTLDSQFAIVGVALTVATDGVAIIYVCLSFDLSQFRCQIDGIQSQ